MSYRVGIDIGGTFTDLVLLGAGGHALTVKVPSTPDDYSRSIAESLEVALPRIGIAGDEVEEVIHGTTVATNAILEKRGVRTGLVTTAGFRDILEIRRLRMPRLYDLTWQKPEALAARVDRVEVAERVDHAGRVLQPLDEASVHAALDRLLANGVRSIAVALINSYANDGHERRIAEMIRERGIDVPLCLSSEVNPELKEYERTSTTVVNAYILPVVGTYLRSLERVLHRLEIAGPLRIMQSNGGAMGVDAAAARPVNIIESGPSAGVVGAAEIAAKLGYENVLTFDMGGTTAKAAMIEGGRYDRVADLDVGAGINFGARFLKGGGYHVSVPAIDIAEVGAGGGSLVRIDAGGALLAGPESAGAMPGPVCYDQGGTVATVTDANVALGFISPTQLVGGELAIRSELSVEAVGKQVAETMGVSVDEASFGIHRVANATMARALRAVSSERGRDPRQFALMVFGGNGPVHAATLARSLDISTILVPPVAGVFSALGLLFPPTEHHLVRTFKRDLADVSPDDIASVFKALEDEGSAALSVEGYGPDMTVFERQADMRYRGENTNLTVSAAAALDEPRRLADIFGEEHERTYGYRSDDEIVEVVNVRLIARGLSAEARVPETLSVVEGGKVSAGEGRRRRSAYFGPVAGRVETPVIERAAVGESWIDGPVIVEEYDSTTVVPPGCRIRRIGWDTLAIDVGPE